LPFPHDSVYLLLKSLVLTVDSHEHRGICVYLLVHVLYFSLHSRISFQIKLYSLLLLPEFFEHKLPVIYLSFIDCHLFQVFVVNLISDFTQLTDPVMKSFIFILFCLNLLNQQLVLIVAGILTILLFHGFFDLIELNLAVFKVSAKQSSCSIYFIQLFKHHV
jgi:hypothetical protein